MGFEVFDFNGNKAFKQTVTPNRNFYSYIFKLLPILMLCQCSSHKVTIEQRGLLALEISNDRERSREYIERRNRTREYLVKLMIEHKNDRFPLKNIDYPSSDISEAEKMAIDIYNNTIIKLSKPKYAERLATLKFLADSRKGEN